MSLWSALKSIWGRVQRVLTHDPRKEILALLSQEYVDKMKDAFQYRRHAEQMRYKHFREKLLRIAEDEEKHAQWLKERIFALGGEIPEISSAIEDGSNTWEDLRLDLTAKKRHLWDLTDRLPMVEPFDAETATTLRRILAEEDNHRAQLTDMLMRSDPLSDTLPRDFA